MALVSSLSPLSLHYQYSNAMSYFYFSRLTSTPPLQSIAASIQNAVYGKPGELALSQVPGAVYPVYLELVPGVDYTGGEFVLNVEFTGLTLAQVTTPITAVQTQDFIFQGTCYFVCQSTITCITAVSCTVTNDRL